MELKLSEDKKFIDVIKVDSIDELDEAIKTFAESLCNYNPEAMKEMKTMFWKGTDDWDTLLKERAKISGRLVLSEFTKETNVWRVNINQPSFRNLFCNTTDFYSDEFVLELNSLLNTPC